jgi:hypothetical protein
MTTIKEEIQTIIDQRNFLDNYELEKQLNMLVWETKRTMLNKAREELEIRKFPKFSIDLFLIKLDEAVK